MPIKKCPNGHTYDTNIYDHCPFCPSQAENSVLNSSNTIGYGSQPVGDDLPTQIMSSKSNAESYDNSGSTIVIPKGMGPFDNDDPGTRIHKPVGQANKEKQTVSTKKLVGVFSTYSKTVNENGEVFKLYEGKTSIGRDDDCDIVINNDEEVSSKHVTILCRNIEGQPLKFFMKDNMSTNGTYLNGNIEDEQVELKSFDVVKIGATELTFIALPH